MSSTMSLQQSVTLVVFLGIFTIFSFCQCSDYGEDYIQKIQNSKAHVNKLASLLAEELLREENDPTKGKEKRLFCANKGCIPKPTKKDSTKIKEKRVFCNGFFGCSNGRKRAQSVDLEPLNYPDVELDNQPDFQKRLFCNPTGCFRKRGTYRGYEKFLEKLGKTGNMAGY